jgi:hypothetical protein
MNPYSYEERQLAAYRVNLKRSLRVRGVEFDNEAATEVLEQLTIANTPATHVTFDRHAVRSLAGKTVAATQATNRYESISDGVDGPEVTAFSVTSYVIGGQAYGSEFFLGK